jgi:hypothetical protein
MKRTITGVVLATALLLAAPFTAAEDSDTLADAITSGKAGVSVRARYEHVDQDGFSETADAITARVRLNYKTSSWRGLSAFAEYDHVFHVLDDFNSGGGTSPNRGQFPVVADPEGADLNQLYFDYAASDSTKLRLGRQKILLDNQRFVGHVGWRQNEQTYDAFSVMSTAISNTTLQYTYIANVRRIFGERSVAAGSDKTNHHLLNARIKLNDSWSMTPYYYLLDYEFGDIVTPLPPDATSAQIAARANDLRRARMSTGTFGVRVAGNVTAGNGKIALVGELATQSDAGDNPARYDADYLHASAMWTMNNGPSLGLAYESLGSDGGTLSFQTPLATLHAFQGWADKFLATPPAGIEDLYATVKFKAGKWNLTGVYHDFTSETGSIDYGTEFDVSAGTKLGENYGILFKAAFFSGDTSPYTDTNKFWIMFTASY